MNDRVIGGKFVGEAIKLLTSYKSKTADELRSEVMENHIVSGLQLLIQTHLDPTAPVVETKAMIGQLYRKALPGMAPTLTEKMFFRLNHLLDEIIYPLLDVGNPMATQGPAPASVEAPSPQPSATPPVQPGAVPDALPGTLPGIPASPVGMPPAVAPALPGGVDSPDPDPSESD